MSVSVDTGNKGGKKPLDADLNLVPYIDLLTCMVAFLLITAVWTQLARLQVEQKGQGQTTGIETPPQTKIAVLVHADGFTLVVDDDQKPLGRIGADLDYARLGAELQALKRTHPDKSDVQVLSEDAIPFEILVKTMDAAMKIG